MKNKVKLLLTIFVFLIAISGCSSSNEKVTKNNVLDKLQGNWIGQNELNFGPDRFEEKIYGYLIFKDNSVLRSDVYDGKFEEITLYSLSSMHFGKQNWDYEYIDENTLILGGQVFNRMLETDENLKYLSSTESSVEKPLLTYFVDNLDEIIIEF